MTTKIPATRQRCCIYYSISSIAVLTVKTVCSSKSSLRSITETIKPLSDDALDN